MYSTILLGLLMFKKLVTERSGANFGRIVGNALKYEQQRNELSKKKYYSRIRGDSYKLDFKANYITKMKLKLNTPLDNSSPYYDYPLQTHSLLINDILQMEDLFKGAFDSNVNKVNSFKFSYKIKLNHGYIALLYSVLNPLNKDCITNRSGIINFTTSEYLDLNKDNSVEFDFKYINDLIVEITFNYNKIDSDFLKEFYSTPSEHNQWKNYYRYTNALDSDELSTNKTYLTFNDISENSFPRQLLNYNINYLKKFLFVTSYKFDSIELDPKDIVNNMFLLEDNILEEQKIILNGKLETKEIQKKTYTSKLNLIDECEQYLNWYETNRIDGDDILNTIIDGMYYYNIGYTSNLVYESGYVNLAVLLAEEK